MIQVAFLMIFVAPVSQSQTSQQWAPANYRGLIVGKSTQTDVLRILGNPKSGRKEQDTGIPYLDYEVSDPVPGTLAVYVRKGTLDGMTLLPKGALTRNDVIRSFGVDYRIVRYATDDCLTRGGAAPIYESPGGQIEHLEYRGRGLAVVLARGDDDKVEAIVFTYKPFGPTHSACAPRAGRASTNGSR